MPLCASPLVVMMSVTADEHGKSSDDALSRLLTPPIRNTVKAPWHRSVSREVSSTYRKDVVVFAAFTPTRVESWHALEHPNLCVKLPFGCCRFRCPLCDITAYPPAKWSNLVNHYEKFHWSSRQYIGKYTCFLCRQDHNVCPSSPEVIGKISSPSSDELPHSDCVSTPTQTAAAAASMTPNVTKVSNRLTSSGNRKRLKRGKANKSERPTLSRPPLISHYHCPMCENNMTYAEFQHLRTHCLENHSGTEADPAITPNSPASVYCPFLEQDEEEFVPLTGTVGKQSVGKNVPESGGCPGKGTSTSGDTSYSLTPVRIDCHENFAETVKDETLARKSLFQIDIQKNKRVSWNEMVQS